MAGAPTYQLTATAFPACYPFMDTMMTHDRNVLSTLKIDENGALRSGIVSSYKRGFSELFDLFAPVVSVRILTKGEPSHLGVKMVGNALRAAIGKASERYRS